MKVITNSKDWKIISDPLMAHQKNLGFIPTMGALHEGHLSLVQRSLKENDKTVVSIFLNPPQFNDSKDLENYPVQLEKDKELLKKNKVDYLFYPSTLEIYSDDYRFKVYEDHLSKKLCGIHRKGHFSSVLTVILKLFNILKPGKAYFGEKDYQQYLLVKGMVESFFLETEILVCPTLREKSGLAMSSRNLRLSRAERKKASEFSEILRRRKSKEEIKKDLKDTGFEVEYVEEHEERRFGAIYFKKVRLIDNVTI